MLEKSLNFIPWLQWEPWFKQKFTTSVSVFLCLLTAALRFLRRMIGLKDDFYNRYIVKCDLLRPVTDAFVANGLTKYNLFNSAVIELFEFIHMVLPRLSFINNINNNIK